MNESWPIRKFVGGVGISTPCGEISTGVVGVVDVWMDSDPGM